MTGDRRLSNLSVVDAEAGPNLIRADLVSEDNLRTMDTSREVIILASASDRGLQTMGEYIDSVAEDIRIQTKTLDLRNGTSVPISHRRATQPTMT